MGTAMAGRLHAPDVKRASDDQIWFRYHITAASAVEIKIYTEVGAVLHTISGLGIRPAGYYDSRSMAIFWDRDTASGRAALGTYYVALLISSVEQDRLRFLLPA